MNDVAFATNKKKGKTSRETSSNKETSVVGGKEGINQILQKWRPFDVSNLSSSFSTTMMPCECLGLRCLGNSHGYNTMLEEKASMPEYWFLMLATMPKLVLNYWI